MAVSVKGRGLLTLNEVHLVFPALSPSRLGEVVDKTLTVLRQDSEWQERVPAGGGREGEGDAHANAGC